MNDELKNDLVDLLRETAEAHHAAVAASGGEDPDWPLWYADHMHARLQELLQIPFTRSELVYCLMRTDSEHSVRAAGDEWEEFCARHFVECFSASQTKAEDKLALYYSRSCPYCHLVLDAVKRLDLDVELREVYEDPAYRNELIEARSRATVPVLRITSPDGEDRWMPESRDIVRYLEGLARDDEAA